MKLELKKVRYQTLSARQKENFNFLKLSAVLADYGYMTMRLSADWQGADFIAQHIDGKTFHKVQLKSRLALGKKYMGKDLHVAFISRDSWYLFPHDDVLRRILKMGRLKGTASWDVRGGYSFGRIPKALKPVLEPFRIHAAS